MRVVFDANVLIAAFATQGLCQALFEVCVRRHEIIVGTQLLDEVGRKLARKLKVPASTVSGVLGYLESHCVIERPVPVPPDACRDPKDLEILGVAAASQADCLVTGDRDLLVLKRYHETEILTPRQLYDALRRTA